IIFGEPSELLRIKRASCLAMSANLLRFSSNSLVRAFRHCCSAVSDESGAPSSCAYYIIIIIIIIIIITINIIIVNIFNYSIIIITKIIILIFKVPLVNDQTDQSPAMTSQLTSDPADAGDVDPLRTAEEADQVHKDDDTSVAVDKDIPLFGDEDEGNTSSGTLKNLAPKNRYCLYYYIQCFYYYYYCYYYYYYLFIYLFIYFQRRKQCTNVQRLLKVQ